jgi:ABC-type branched-subunit amino acid transport system substrate-binding protein
MRADARRPARVAGALLLATAAAAPSGRALAAEPDVVALGRRIFVEGHNERGEPIRALLGTPPSALAGAAVACGNCHGADGRGRPEGGVVPPDITWPELTKPYGHVRSGGRAHGPYDERSFARAVTEGLDPAGQRIEASMPRYSLSAGELAALAAYLKQLPLQRDPGIADATLRLGTILPDSGPGADTAAAMRSLLHAAIADLNERGGIHGRALELVIASDAASAAERFRAQPVFALVAPYAIGSEKALARLSAEQRLGVVAPFTLATAADSPLQMFYLYPGVADLARVLFDYAARGADMKTQRMAAFVEDGDDAMALGLRAQCQRHQCGGLEVLPVRAAAEPGAVARLAHAGVQSVFFAGGDRELAALLSFADKLGWRPAVYAPGSSAARAMYAAPPSFEGRLFVALPTRADLQSATPAAAAFERLRTSRRLGSAHSAAQGFAYAAMAIAAEGLRQAGRDLSRERFARMLEALHRFDAGPTPPVSYGPGRRVGAFGGYVVAVDPGRGFRPVSDWIGLDLL